MRTRRDVRGEKKKMERMFVSPEGLSAQSLLSKYPLLGNSEKFDSRNSLEAVRAYRAPGRVVFQKQLAYDIRAGRLVSSSRVASRPLAGQMTGTHVFSH